VKARNREINIFNMSLLDILCGALGAFCFLALTLFPYYGKESKESGGASVEDVQELQQKLDDALKAAASGDTSGAVAILREEMEQAQQALEKETAARQQAEQAAHQAQEAAQRAQQAAQQAENAKELRHPVVVQIVWSGPGQDVDLFILRPTKEKIEPAPDADKKQETYINGDTRTDCKGANPCMELWLMRDVPVGIPAKIYYKLMDVDKIPGSSVVSGLALNSSGGGLAYLPSVTLSASQKMVMVGSLTLQEDQTLKFEASPEAAAAAPANAPKGQ